MIVKAPIIKTTDLLVVGGSLNGIRTALAAKQLGFSVFCITPMAYFGEDCCAHFDLQDHYGDADWRALFEGSSILSPMDAKLKLEKMLIESGIGFIYQVNPVCPVYDDNGDLAGLIVADRSGFQAIQAKVVLDATENSLVAKACSLKFSEFASGKHDVIRYQLGGANGTKVDKLSLSYDVEGNETPVFRSTEQMDIQDATPATLAKAEVQAKLLSWHQDMTYGSDISKIKGLPQVATGYAPTTSMPIFIHRRFDDTQLFRYLASLPRREMLCTGKKAISQSSVLCRKDTFHRFGNCSTVELDLDSFPVNENCDVLVIGGGTGGGPAAIAAARAGAKTICAETLWDLGGIMTSGRVCAYWFGNRVGFTSEIDNALLTIADTPKHSMETGRSDIEAKKHYLLREAAAAGAELRFGCTAVAVSTNGNAVTGALLATPYGLWRIESKIVIDSTGNADIVAAAGGETVMASQEEPSVQGAGLPYIQLGVSTNTDYQFICDHDILDCTKSFVMARSKFSNHFDIGQMPDTRERRRIVGDITLQPQDFYINRKYCDTIVQANSNFDTHGFIVHPMFMHLPTGRDPHFADVPFRALLPKTLENVAVTGLAVSAQRDCMPLIRMQPDVQNQGYAIGLAAADAAKTGCTLRKIDVKALQKKLVEIGILSANVPAETDGVPEINEEDPYCRLSAIFTYPEKHLPALQKAFDDNPSDLESAQLLAFLGEKRVRAALAKAVKDAKWDEGWNYRGMGQFGFSVSPLDCMIFALSAIGGDRDAILRKINTLWPDEAFSHFRAVCMALMKHPDADAVPRLEELLQTPGMSGYAIKDFKDARRANRVNEDDPTYRNCQLKEFYLAKALHACDPENTLANSILSAYHNGLMGYFTIRS